MTIVDRATRCFLAIEAVYERTRETGQAMLEQARARQYCSDLFALYRQLRYRRSYHLALPDKSQTYSVEACNAELRHYLRRLTRRSRCFSRHIEWLRRYLKAFAYVWNLRQMHNRAHPYAKKHVIDFVCL